VYSGAALVDMGRVRAFHELPGQCAWYCSRTLLPSVVEKMVFADRSRGRCGSTVGLLSNVRIFEAAMWSAEPTSWVV
jgi:hypothetical protein